MLLDNRKRYGLEVIKVFRDAKLFVQGLTVYRKPIFTPRFHYKHIFSPSVCSCHCNLCLLTCVHSYKLDIVQNMKRNVRNSFKVSGSHALYFSNSLARDSFIDCLSFSDLSNCTRSSCRCRWHQILLWLCTYWLFSAHLSTLKLLFQS